MNDIRPINMSTVIRYVPPPPSQNDQQATLDESRFSDEAFQLDLSDRASRLAEMVRSPETRAERIVRLRDEIAGGSYLTHEKIGIVAERLIDGVL